MKDINDSYCAEFPRDGWTPPLLQSGSVWSAWAGPGWLRSLWEKQPERKIKSSRRFIMIIKWELRCSVSYVYLYYTTVKSFRTLPFLGRLWRGLGNEHLALVCGKGLVLSPPALEMEALNRGKKDLFFTSTPLIWLSPLCIGTRCLANFHVNLFKSGEFFLCIGFLPLSVKMWRQRVTKVSAPLGQFSTRSSSSGEFIPIPRIYKNGEKTCQYCSKWTKLKTFIYLNSFCPI